MNTDDVRRLYSRDVALADDVKRRDSDPNLGAPSVLVRTTARQAYPATPQCYFACQPVTLLGTETEGSAGLTTPAGSTFLALNLGGGVPPDGTTLLATFVGNRWVFRYDA